jgi:hypothetical protein
MNKKILKKILKIVNNSIVCLVFLLASFNFFRSDKLYAANVLTNPSFTGNANNWTLTGSASYYASPYQDSAGSLGAQTTAGRNITATGDATQTISTTIEGGSAVALSFYWAKQCVAVTCTTNTITVDIQEGTGTFQTVWSNTTTPSPASPSWTGVSSLDVTSYFPNTATYTIRLTFSFRNGNNGSAQSLAWFDNLNLDVTPPYITVGTTGTQISETNPGSTEVYMGGAFTFIRSSGSTSVTSIKISQTGTVASSDLSGLILYYKQESTCSTSIPGDATQFNNTAGTFSSGSSTVTGSMTVGTSQVCIYVELDVGSGAQEDQTIDIQITNPSTDVLASLGTVTPATAVAINGTTYITPAGFLSVDIVDASDVSVSTPSVQFNNASFSWITLQTTATLGVTAQQIKVSNYSISHSWTLSIAATDGVSALWESTSHSYDYNGLASAGRLQVNPNSATITPGSGCSDTGLTKQSSAYFASGSVDSINLVIAGGTAQVNCDWYITGIGLTQDIPAEQLPGEYSIGMTITVI